MRKPKEKIRTPSYIRSSQPDRLGTSDMSVGDVLRIERRKLVIRQLMWLLIFLFIVATIVALIALGYFEMLIDLIVEQLL